MKKLLVIISVILFIAALPILVNAGKAHQNTDFNKYEQSVDNNTSYWQNEYWPMYKYDKTMYNRHGYVMRYQNRMTRHYRYIYNANRRLTQYFTHCNR